MRHNTAAGNHGSFTRQDGVLLSVLSRAQVYQREASQQPWGWFFLVLAINLALVGVLMLLDRQYGIDYWYLVRDPNAVADQPAYFGFYSNLGVLLWAAAAATALLAAACLRQSGSADRRIRVLLLGGLFCMVACLDDLFMLHEHSYLFGIPEMVTMAAYALLLLAFMAAALPIAHLTKWILLAMSLVFLAFSALVDMADLTMPGSVLMEEAFKFSGIAFLAAYLVSLSFSALVSGLGRNKLR